MDRQEISKRLVQLREDANIGKNELCRSTGFTFHQLQRLEAASNNYKLPLMLTYLKNVNGCIALEYNGKRINVAQYSDIPACIKQMREGRFTTRSLAQAAGCSFTGLNYVETQKTELHVDLFIKLCNALDIQIIINNLQLAQPSHI